MNAATDKHRIETHTRGPDDVRLQPIADGENLARRRVTGTMQRMAVDRLVGLAVPRHSAAQPRVDIGDRSGACLGDPATDHHPVRIQTMHLHVAFKPALELGTVFLRVGPALNQARAGEISEIVIVGDAYAPSLKDFTVGLPAQESYPPTERLQRLDAGFAAGSDEVIRVARQCDARELLLNRVGGPRRVGDQDDTAPFPAPLPQPLGRAGIEGHAVVNDSPYVAEDQPVFWVQRIEKAHSRPASAKPRSIGATSSGLLSSRRANGGVSTSTTCTGMPATRNRSCSSPSSVSSSLIRVAA